MKTLSMESIKSRYGSIKDSKDDLISESIRKAIEPEQDCTTVLVHHTLPCETDFELLVAQLNMD